MSGRTTWAQWYQSLPIPWLVAGVNGQAEGNSWPAVLDQQIVLLDAARKVAFPDYAPTDALPNLGGDRKLAQGPTESNANFIIRLKDPWSDWARAGTWLELLVQLYWAGFNNAVIVQQNGLAYQLSGAPTAGADPTGLLTITTCSALSAALTSNVTPPTLVSAGRSIAAATPWWHFAESRAANPNVSDTDYCNRFAILFPGPLPTSFLTWARVTFAAASSGAAVWNNVFPDATYVIGSIGVTITDGGPAVMVHADGTTKTTTGVTLVASDPFTGYADVIAFQAGANPYADLHPADLARLQFCIRTWRPNALCVGVYAVAQGNMYGWPVRAFSALNPQPCSIVRFEGA